MDETEQGPTDPMTGFLELAVITHQVYLEYIEAGFAESQAFELVKVMVAANQGGAR